ncbi:PorT family protein [Flavobacterium sp. CYK-4]|uniref:porin family protein n=1 Tax=Flavobacterium lotistagni TaxID=2709660 RepID=UPI0014077A64|nr:porin family protein [Flavobacterium lotistagni]NHM07086.1 PorT family protein [Flavobacterium lotistagni]
MKKSLFVLVVLFSVVINAQQKGTVEFGSNIGFNRSAINSSEGSTDAGSGFNIGVSADYYFSRTWSIKTKLIYDQKGWDNGFIEFYSFDPNVIDSSYKTDFNLNYLTIPVMANWHFGRTKNWYLNFGPYAGFLLNAEETRFSTDVKEGFNTTDFGVALGVGVKIPVSNKLKIFFEYEENYGFSEVFKEAYSATRNVRSSFNFGVNFLMK